MAFHASRETDLLLPAYIVTEHGSSSHRLQLAKNRKNGKGLRERRRQFRAHETAAAAWPSTARERQLYLTPTIWLLIQLGRFDADTLALCTGTREHFGGRKVGLKRLIRPNNTTRNG